MQAILWRFMAVAAAVIRKNTMAGIFSRNALAFSVHSSMIPAAIALLLIIPAEVVVYLACHIRREKKQEP